MVKTAKNNSKFEQFMEKVDKSLNRKIRLSRMSKGEAIDEGVDYFSDSEIPSLQAVAEIEREEIERKNNKGLS